MKIEVEIDDNELQETVKQVVAKHFFDSYSPDQRLLKKVVEKAVKDVLLQEKERIVERAINVAAVKIAYGAAPKLVEKLAKESVGG